MPAHKYDDMYRMLDDARELLNKAANEAARLDLPKTRGRILNPMYETQRIANDVLVKIEAADIAHGIEHQAKVQERTIAQLGYEFTPSDVLGVQPRVASPEVRMAIDSRNEAIKHRTSTDIGQMAAYANLAGMNAIITLNAASALGSRHADPVACPAEIPAPPDTSGPTNTEPFCGGNYDSN